MASGQRGSDLSDLGPKVAASTHPIYQLLKPTWVQLAHVREGTGGFLDGTYLAAHPREWLDHTVSVTDAATGVVTTRLNPTPKQASPKLLARRLIARYENVASAIIAAKKAVLFREQPTRQVGDAGAGDGATSALEQWWDDVDGRGTHIDDAMMAWWDMAATFGHVVLYVDLPSDNEAATAADQRWPYVRLYTPLDVLHWLYDENGEIISVKFLETVPPTDYNAGGLPTYRVRVVTETSWTVYEFKSGKAVATGEHKMGRLPVVFLYAKRRALLSDVGESVLGDPRNYVDLYNLTSEIRELLRNQTFSFINIPLGTGPDAMGVEDAQAMMGKQTGTMNVVYSGAAAQILTGDPANVASYHDEIARVKREIYREAGVQWSTDTKDAEAAGSLELKREEMTTRIGAYADECQQAEYDLVDLWYRAMYGADRGPSKLAQDVVTIHYPDRFTQTPFDEILLEIQAAQAINMPAAFLKALRKAILTKFEGMGNLSAAEIDVITEAIDSAPDDLTPQALMKQKLDLMTAGVKAGGLAPEATPTGIAAAGSGQAA